MMGNARWMGGFALAASVAAIAVVPSMSEAAPLEWAQQDELRPDDPATEDRFGFSVAVDGDTAIVGAPGQRRAYVFVREGEGWVVQRTLAVDSLPEPDELGHSVALDGDAAVVGAPAHDGDEGAAYVFERDGSMWSEQERLHERVDLGARDRFGHDVAIDGDLVLVGAPGDDSGMGIAYVLAPGATVPLEQFIGQDQRFGYSVALRGDTAIVGGPVAAVAIEDNGGTAQVFEHETGEWNYGSNLATEVEGGIEVGDRFGAHLASDGDMALVGAPGAETAYLFEREDEWAELMRFESSGDVALATDVAGDRIVVVVGSPSDETDASGATTVFELEDGFWNSHGLVTEGPTPPTFGTAIAIDGETIVVGAPGSNAAYVFVVDRCPEDGEGDCPLPDGGMADGGVAPDGGTADGGRGDGGPRDAAAGDAAKDGVPRPETSCTCRVPGGRPSRATPSLAWLASMLLAGLCRRRRSCR